MSNQNVIAKSIKWSSLGEILAKLIVPITNMVLARVLMPEDFGILASINMIISFVDLFTDSGFAKYLIQCDFDTIHERNQFANIAFWTNFAISSVMCLMLCAFKAQVAVIVGNPGYGNVIAVASFQLLITSFSSIQTALFRRDFDFKTLFITRVTMALVPLAITVPLAIITRSYWALVIGSMASAFINAVILTLKSKWKPQLYYNFIQLKKMLSFSIWSLAEAVAYWLTTWVDAFIIGVAFSAYYLGIYKNSLNMVNSIMALVKASIIPVLFSSLSRLKYSQIEFETVYYSVQRLTACVLMPMGVGLFVFRNLATMIIFGSKWSEASNIVGVWSLASTVFIIFTSFNGEAYKAKGKPKVLFAFEIAYLLIMIPICYLAKEYGFWNLVYTRSLLIVVQMIIGLGFMRIFLKFKVCDMLKNILEPFICAMVMGSVGFILLRINEGVIWQFLYIVICSFVYFILLFVFFKNKLESDLKVFKTNYNMR